ncbi:MAG: N-acetylglucosamine-6-phosphate deacetylase [Rubrobacteraceae bacterium]
MTLVGLLGRLVTDYEVWDEAAVLIEGGTIREVGPDRALLEAADEVYDCGDHFLLPGFVDLQVNGGFGVDLATEPGRAPELSEKLLTTGVTSYAPTLISAPETLYDEALAALESLSKAPGAGAEILGIHLEGPFISAEKRGAHDASYVRKPDPTFLGLLLERGIVRMITLAPEVEGADELVALAASQGVTVAAGHSNATFEEAYDSFDRRVTGVTHLFNAMGAMHHRQPGLAGAAFAHPRVTCGLIADGLHVHPEMIGLAFRMLGPDRIYLTTDSTAATGMNSGEYPLATRRIYHDANMARLGSGAIAGSLLTMLEAFQNILAFTGCTIAEASRMASTTPARLCGEGRRKGRLVPGYDADVTVLGPDLSVKAVWKAGDKVY